MIRKLGMAVVTASAIAVLATATTGWAADKPVFGLVMSFSGWFAPIDADTIAGPGAPKSKSLGKRIALAPLPITSTAPSAPSGGSDLLSNSTVSIG